MSESLIGHAMSVPDGIFNGTGASNNAIPLGSRVISQSGVEYARALVGAVALAPGKLYQAPAEITNHQGLTPAAAAIGALEVTVTLGATAATANYYADGSLVVTITPGQGYRYRILSHPAADALATLVLTLVPSEPIQVALTTSSRVDLFPNIFSNVVVNPTSATSAPVGASVNTAGIGKYTWLARNGDVVLLADGTVTVGTALVASNATAGAVEALTGVQAAIGNALTGIATTDYGLVNLSL